MTCTAIVPFYNERKRIGRVLDQLINVRNLQEIICVDDGSTDNTSQLIKKNYPTITLVRLTKDRGKTAAVYEGLKKVKTEYVFLCDADLHDLKKDEVEKAIKTTLNNSKIDMLILRRTRSICYTRWTRSDIILSGERMLRKKDLVHILKTKPKHYQLEVAINKYMIDNKKNVCWIPSSALSVFKIHKVGIFKGLVGEAKMINSLFGFAGAHEYWRQIFFFCHKKFS